MRVCRQRRRWRRRRGALVGGAAAHLLGAAQVFGVVSAGAPHGAAGTPLGRLHTRLHGAPRPRQTTPPTRPGSSYKLGGQSAPGGATRPPAAAAILPHRPLPSPSSLCTRPSTDPLSFSCVFLMVRLPSSVCGAKGCQLLQCHNSSSNKARLK